MERETGFKPAPPSFTSWRWNRVRPEPATTQSRKGVSLREIAESISRGLKLPLVSKSPEAAGDHFGWLGMFAGAGIPASSALTRKWLGSHPMGVGLFSDLDQARFEA